MNLVEFFQRQALNSGTKIMPFLIRQSNPVTGAPIPQAADSVAPPAPPVII